MFQWIASAPFVGSALPLTPGKRAIHSDQCEVVVHTAVQALPHECDTLETALVSRQRTLSATPSDSALVRVSV